MKPQQFRYALFACGLSAGVVCFSLILIRDILKLPVNPATIFYLLVIPPAGFYLWSEYARMSEKPSDDARDASAILLALLLSFYVLAPLNTLLLFPDYPITIGHYHHYALPALIAAILLIRVYACGGALWEFWLGTAAGLLAWFFLLTAMPLVSPLSAPAGAISVAIGLTVFLTVSTRGETGIVPSFRQFANLTNEQWQSLKLFALMVLATITGLCFWFDSQVLLTPRPPVLNQVETLFSLETSSILAPMTPQALYFLTIVGLAGLIALSFSGIERFCTEARYRRLTLLLWLILPVLLVYSACLSYVAYTFSDTTWLFQVQVLLWAVVSLLIGRFLNLPPLWLWGLFCVYPLVLSGVGHDSLRFMALHPLALAGLSLLLAMVSVITQNFPILATPKYPWPWAQNRWLQPGFLFSAVSQFLVYLAFAVAAFGPAYRYEWSTAIGLFGMVIPEVVMTHTLGTSRHFLLYLPYTFAWINLLFTVSVHFPAHSWLSALQPEHLINCGLFAALLTATIGEAVLNALQRPFREDALYRLAKDVAAIGIPIFTLWVYSQECSLNGLSWQRILTSGLLNLGVVVYWLIGRRIFTRQRLYPFFAGSLTLSLMCFSILLIQHLLNVVLAPSMMLWMLALPPVVFYLHSEYLFRCSRQFAQRDSQVAAEVTTGRPTPAYYTATILLFGLLLVYIFPPFIRLLLFPDYHPNFFHYVHYAPLALGVGLLLIRLHGVGGGALLVIVGVIANITALFLLGIRVPELFGNVRFESFGKTFEFFTIVMLSISYFLIGTTGPNGILKRALIALGHLSERRWTLVRRLIVVITVGLSHLMFGLLLLTFSQQQRLIGVILLLLAGLFIVMGLTYRQILFHSVAFIEALAAIFSCRVAPAYWRETWIIWLLVGLFIALIPLYSLFLRDRYLHATGSLHCWLGLTVACVLSEQIVFAGKHSGGGITPLVLIWLAAFAIPVMPFARTRTFFQWFLGGLIYAPAFFFFVQHGPPSIAYLPQAMLTAVLTSCLLVAYRVYNWQWFTDAEVQEARIVHHLHWFLMQPYSLLTIFGASTLAVLVVHLLSHSVSPKLFADQFFSMLLAQGILTVYWFDLAQKKQAWWATVTAELMTAGVILTLRQGLPMRLNLNWSPQWDMLIGLVISAAVIFAKPLLQQQNRAIRLPIRITLFGLPLVTALYALNPRVDFEFFALIILPVYSVFFFIQAYSEKDRFIMAYAFFGINAYLVLLLFHNQIRSPQAYVTPVCISILILVEVFRDLTSRTTANVVRTAALLMMLGVALLQAIGQHALSPMYHLSALGLSLLAVIAAIVRRVRVFVVLGWFSFMIDLIAILYIVLSRQDIETLKVVLGLGLTSIGLLTLAGYYFYRTHKTQIDALTMQMKGVFQSWE